MLFHKLARDADLNRGRSVGAAIISTKNGYHRTKGRSSQMAPMYCKTQHRAADAFKDVEHHQPGTVLRPLARAEWARGCSANSNETFDQKELSYGVEAAANGKSLRTADTRRRA